MLRSGSQDLEFQVIKGDNYPTFEMTLYEKDNETPLDISLPSTKIFIMVKRPDGAFLDISVSKNGDGKNGAIFHKWSSEEISVLGLYEVEARAVFDGGERYTCLKRVKFEVLNSLRGD